MRITLISEAKHSHQDSVGNVLLHLLDHLETHGHESLGLTSNGVPVLFGRSRVESVQESWRGGDPYSNILQALHDFQPDVVHALQPNTLGVDGMRAARQLGLPVLASYHGEPSRLAEMWGFGMPGELMWSYFRVMHDLADLSLVPTYFHQMQLREQGFTRVKAWGHGVDADLFSPSRRSSAWRRHLSDGEVNKTLLVFAGKLSSEKHIELLKPVIEASPDCRLAIVGAGSEATWLRDYFEGTPTIFTGYLDQGDMAEVYASADAFIQPASTMISPVTTLEAMASGLPVLAPHSAAILEFAVHGENALLFPAGDTEMASAYVRQLASKPRLRADLSRMARQTALAHTWQIAMKQITKSYTKLVEQTPSLISIPSSFQSLPLSQLHN